MAAKLKRLLRALMMTGLILVGSIFTASSALADGEEDDWEHETICDGFNRLKISWDSSESNGIVNVSGEVTTCNSTDYPSNGTYEFIISQDSQSLLTSISPDDSLSAEFSFELPSINFQEETMIVYPIWKTTSSHGGDDNDGAGPDGDDGLPAVSPSLPSVNLLPMYECTPHEPWRNMGPPPPSHIEIDFKTQSELLALTPSGVATYDLSATTACNGYPIFIDEINWLDWHTQYYPLASTYCEYHLHRVRVLTYSTTSGSPEDPYYSDEVWSQIREEISGTAAHLAANCKELGFGSSIAMNSRYMFYDNLNLQLNSKWNVLESEVALILLDSNNNIQTFTTNAIRPIWVDEYNYDYTKYGLENVDQSTARTLKPFQHTIPTPYQLEIDVTNADSDVVLPQSGDYTDMDVHSNFTFNSSINAILASGTTFSSAFFTVLNISIHAEYSSGSQLPPGSCDDEAPPGQPPNVAQLSWEVALLFELVEVDNPSNVQHLWINQSGGESNLQQESIIAFVGAGPHEDADETDWEISFERMDYYWGCYIGSWEYLSDSGSENGGVNDEFVLTIS